MHYLPCSISGGLARLLNLIYGQERNVQSIKLISHFELTFSMVCMVSLACWNTCRPGDIIASASMNLSGFWSFIRCTMLIRIVILRKPVQGAANLAYHWVP